MLKRSVLGIVAGFFIASGVALALEENPITVQLHLEPNQVERGEATQLSLDITVAPGFHAYRDMMGLQWIGPGQVKFDTFEIQPTKNFNDPFSKRTREAIEGQAALTTTVHIPQELPLGDQVGKVEFSYQACSAKYCLFPKKISLDVPFKIVNERVRKMDPASMLLGSGGDDIMYLMKKSKIWAFLLVFFGGFLTSLTPCIFPMIPITISVIGARSLESKKRQGFLLSLTYVLGLAFTYSTLGVIAAKTGAFFGSALSNIWVVGFIALVFSVMGLSMLGFFEIQLPLALQNRIHKLSGHHRTSPFPKAFLAGLFAGIVASPCVGPVLVGILAYVAKTAEAFFGFALLFTFALGMGILFLVLGTFSGLLSKLPRSGPWMDNIKFIFGITFIAMAFYYLYPILPRFIFDFGLSLALILGASYYGAFQPASKTHRGQLKKGFWIANFAAGLVFMWLAVRDNPFFAPREITSNAISQQVQTANVNAMKWMPYTDDGIAQAKSKGRPVIIDFTADWCLACHELDNFTYSDPTVIAKSSRFDLFKVDATHITNEVKTLQQRYIVLGLPTIIFIDAQGKIRYELGVTGFMSPKDFLKRMQKAEAEN